MRGCGTRAQEEIIADLYAAGIDQSRDAHDDRRPADLARLPQQPARPDLAQIAERAGEHLRQERHPSPTPEKLDGFGKRITFGRVTMENELIAGLETAATERLQARL